MDYMFQYVGIGDNRDLAEKIALDQLYAVRDPIRSQQLRSTRDNRAQIKEYAVHRRIFLQDRANQLSMPTGNVGERSDVRGIIGFEHRRDLAVRQSRHRL